MRPHDRILILALIGAAALWYGPMENRTTAPLALAQSPAASELAVPVTVGVVETRDVPIYLTGIGSVQPLNQVTVKVRVDGQLDHIAFIEGQQIHTGDA